MTARNTRNSTHLANRASLPTTFPSSVPSDRTELSMASPSPAPGAAERPPGDDEVPAWQMIFYRQLGRFWDQDQYHYKYKIQFESFFALFHVISPVEV